MEPEKLIESNQKENKFDNLTGLIMSDGKQAKLIIFNYWGNPAYKTDLYIETEFKNYCKENNLKQL
jgi:hypothetical protein